MKLLRTHLDYAGLPDDLWEFGSQFIISRGYEHQIDVDSLMVLLWNMQRRIEKLESGLQRGAFKNKSEAQAELRNLGSFL